MLSLPAFRGGIGFVKATVDREELGLAGGLATLRIGDVVVTFDFVVPATAQLQMHELYVDMAQIGGSSLVQETDSPHLSDHCPSVISLR
ncbi:hypothetical protein AJ88_24050 [Mesorhizobium amorphae CCBAU 01583]|nr:hypothetical protein AJ88_24050 [Mesorhizobium amorphae CCBAU 01583]